MDEIGRQVILEGVEHPARNRSSFQQVVLSRQLEKEASLHDVGGVWYLDRGLLDGAAYFQLHEGRVPAHYRRLIVSHYRVALVLEPLSTFTQDGVRPEFEDLEYTKKITPLLADFYRACGVPTVMVPDGSIQERVEFVEAVMASYVDLAIDQFYLSTGAFCPPLLMAG